ncbi:MAG: hypothetical protein WBA74_12070 [Cyclobacteriaceae bacterium]
MESAVVHAIEFEENSKELADEVPTLNYSTVQEAHVLSGEAIICHPDLYKMLRIDSFDIPPEQIS